MKEPIGYLLKQAQYALRGAMDESLSSLDMSAPQYAALNALHIDGGVSNAELARRCFVTPQTMHRLVRRLEDLGWLRRSDHPEHGRIVRLHLTDAGRGKLEAAQREVDGVEQAMIADLSEEERAELSGMLKRCVAGLEGDAG